jgi:hypothetical protein
MTLAKLAHIVLFLYAMHGVPDRDLSLYAMLVVIY